MLALLLIACPKPTVAPTPPGCPSLEEGQRAFTVLHLNDVYRVEGLLDGRGGLARVRALREELEVCGPVLLTHAGDAFFPSLMSREYKGQQMVDVLNLLDGAAGRTDPLMVAVFGNHEFDKRGLDFVPTMNQLLRGSEFTWLDTSITWKTGEDGAPLVSAPALRQELLVEVSGVKVGIFGLTIDNAIPAYASISGDNAGLARSHSASLREQGAEVVIALTHLDREVDAALLAELGDQGPDLVLGGHNHSMSSTEVEGRYVLKGDADAVTVRTPRVTVGAEGRVSVQFAEAGVPLGPDTMPADPAVAEAVAQLQQRFSVDWCGAEDPDCLAEELTVTNTLLEAEETWIRLYESNLGDYVADQMLDTFADQGAQVAFINSGSLRLNQNVSAGTPLTMQVIEELFQYPAPMKLIRITGEQLQQVVDRSVQEWAGNGHWLQIGGFAYAHDVEAGTATRLTLLGPEGPLPITPEMELLAVTNDYLLDPSGDQDGYTMLSREQVVESPHDGTDLKEVTTQTLRAAGEAGIAPRSEGRICSSDKPGPCLAQ